jgi:hypothetical protein
MSWRDLSRLFARQRRQTLLCHAPGVNTLVSAPGNARIVSPNSDGERNGNLRLPIFIFSALIDRMFFD